jgi:uncharacterized protein YjiS (DUF1127 family)
MTANALTAYRSPKPRPRPLWRRLVDGIRTVLEAYAAARRMRKAVRALQRLDDRTLADIGVPRSGIEAAVRDDDRKAPLLRPAAARPRPMRLAA